MRVCGTDNFVQDQMAQYTWLLVRILRAAPTYPSAMSVSLDRIRRVLSWQRTCFQLLITISGDVLFHEGFQDSLTDGLSGLLHWRTSATEGHGVLCCILDLKRHLVVCQISRESFATELALPVIAVFLPFSCKHTWGLIFVIFTKIRPHVVSQMSEIKKKSLMNPLLSYILRGKLK